MQETQRDGEKLREFFQGNSEEELKAKMDMRLKELEGLGHILVGRTKIGRNAPCPCGSGKKYKKCCIDKAR